MVPGVPGMRAIAFASRWFDPETVHRVFEPLVADWQREWRDAPPVRRVAVSVRGLAAFIFSFVILTPRILRTSIPQTTRWNVTIRIATFCLIIGGLLSIPLVQSIGKQSMEPLSLPLLILFALPTGLTLSLPFAMAIAVDGIRRDRTLPAQVERAAALKLAVATFVVMTLANGFLIPAANQVWRERSTPAGWNVPPPRISESSTLALLRHPDRNGPIVEGNYTRAGDIRQTLVGRVVTSILPALLIWLRWQATNRRRRAWYSPLPSALATAAGVVGVFAFWAAGAFLELRAILPWALGLWTPVVGLLAYGLAARAWSQRLEASSPQNNRIA